MPQQDAAAYFHLHRLYPYSLQNQLFSLVSAVARRAFFLAIWLRIIGIDLFEQFLVFHGGVVPIRAEAGLSTA